MDYTKKAFEIIDNLEQCANGEYQFYDMDKESCEILLAYIYMQENVINAMLNHIEKKGCDFDNRIQTKEQILQYFFNIIYRDYESEVE